MKAYSGKYIKNVGHLSLMYFICFDVEFSRQHGVSRPIRKYQHNDYRSTLRIHIENNSFSFVAEYELHLYGNNRGHDNQTYLIGKAQSLSQRENKGFSLDVKGPTNAKKNWYIDKAHSECIFSLIEKSHCY